SSYKNSKGEIKGRVVINNAAENNYYALLKETNGKPDTDEKDVVKVWVAPNEDGQVIFDELTLDSQTTKFYVVTKPQTFLTFDYEDATYSPTEVYKSGDTIPDGFAINDPVLIATQVEINKMADYLSLSVTELTRSIGAPNDTLTITYDSSYRMGTTFASGITAICYDGSKGPVGGVYSTVSLNGKSTATLTIPTGKDCMVLLKIDDVYTTPLTALCAPELLKIDYINETLIRDSDGGYDTLGNIDYHAKVGSNYDVNLGSDTEFLQGSNSSPISLTSALDDIDFDANATLEYRKHIVDQETTIATLRTLTIPNRPDAIIVEHRNEDVNVDYINEEISNNLTKKILVSKDNFNSQSSIGAMGALSFTDIGWTGNIDLPIKVRLSAIANTSFKGKISNPFTILKRPDAPEVGSDKININISGTTISFENNYDQEIDVTGTTKQGTPLESNGLPATNIGQGSSADYTSHTDGNIYSIYFSATVASPRSKELEYSTPFVIPTVDFGDIEYGKLGPSTTTGLVDVITKIANIQNISDTNDYYIDGTYDTSSVLDFDGKNIFSLTNENIYDYGSDGIDVSDFANLLGSDSGTQLVNRNTTNTSLLVALGNMENGAYSPTFGVNNINETPVGLYETTLPLRYADDDVMSSNVVDLSLKIKLNVIRIDWSAPKIATQATQTSSGTDGDGLEYTVTANSLSFDVAIDQDVITTNTLEISTDGGMNWNTVSSFSASSSSYTSAGQVVKRITISNLTPATTYTVLARVEGDNNHNASSETSCTFWTCQAKPTNKDSFVDYYSELLKSVSNLYNVKSNNTPLSDNTSLTSYFVVDELKLKASTKASGNYPESDEAEFTYTRPAKPTLNLVGESIYLAGNGSISSTGAIDIRNENGSYSGTGSTSKNGLFSGVYFARIPATNTSFASSELKVLLVPTTYNIRVKADGNMSFRDESVGSDGYTRELESSIWFKKDEAQVYNSELIYPTFSRIGYTAQQAQKIDDEDTDFTKGSDSVVDGAEFDDALDLFNAFKSNLDENGNFALKVLWYGYESPIYTVTIPTSLSATDTDTDTSPQVSGSVSISAWNNEKGERTIPKGSKVNIKLSENNSNVLTLEGTTLNYTLKLAGEETVISNGGIISELSAENASSTPVNQGIDVYITGTPVYAGQYAGSITFEAEVIYASEN
ncbi:MAG: hypothetical protein LBR30_05195, partial [Clostridioides sp.]|nr:hypothetical protein [Clostridioides sp.]